MASPAGTTMEGGLGEGKQAGEIPLYKYGGRAASGFQTVSDR